MFDVSDGPDKKDSEWNETEYNRIEQTRLEYNGVEQTRIEWNKKE